VNNQRHTWKPSPKSGGRGAQGPAASGLRAPRLAAARAFCCAVLAAPSVKRCAFPAVPCALCVAPRGALSLPGVTPDPLLARRRLGLSCAVLLHVARQPSPSALSAHRTPPRWPAARGRAEAQATETRMVDTGRKPENTGPCFRKHGPARTQKST
jgi:hypothetical protein